MNKINGFVLVRQCFYNQFGFYFHTTVTAALLSYNICYQWRHVNFPACRESYLCSQCLNGLIYAWLTRPYAPVEMQ